jgi:hypothetical protein
MLNIVHIIFSLRGTVGGVTDEQTEVGDKDGQQDKKT